MKQKQSGNRSETALKEKQTAASQSSRFFRRFISVSDLFQICFKTVSIGLLFQISFRFLSVSFLFPFNCTRAFIRPLRQIQFSNLGGLANFTTPPKGPKLNSTAAEILFSADFRLAE